MAGASHLFSLGSAISVTDSSASSCIDTIAVVKQSKRQSLSSIPACGQTCINNALAESASLGCPLVNGQVNGVCLCASANFGYAIRDCSNQACPSGTDVSSIISYAIAYCDAVAGVSATATSTSTSASPSSSRISSTPSSSSTLSTLSISSTSSIPTTAANTPVTSALPTSSSSSPSGNTEVTSSISSSSTVTRSNFFSSSSTTTNSAGSITTIYITGSPSATPSSLSSGGLSTSAKVGLGVGIPLGFVAILAVLGFIWFRRRKQNSTKNAVVNSNRDNADDRGEKSELPAITVKQISRMTKPELQAITPKQIQQMSLAELEALEDRQKEVMTKPELEGFTVATHEMVTNANRHEMESPGVSATLTSPWSIDGRAELPGTAH